MHRTLLFLSIMFLTNGIPHFVNGISGREFVEPFLYRHMGFLSNQLFNTLWGILSFFLALVFYRLYRATGGKSVLLGFTSDTLVIFASLIFTSLGLCLLFSQK